jgi:hypothetical protein
MGINGSSEAIDPLRSSLTMKIAESWTVSSLSLRPQSPGFIHLMGDGFVLGVRTGTEREHG